MGDWEASARRRIEQINIRKPIDLGLFMLELFNWSDS